jgi:predicted Zn finger-like uncharacterized protein
MHLVCPACETAYDVPGAALRPGRRLRCAVCRHEWVPLPAAPEPELSFHPPSLSPDSEPMAPVPLPRTSQAKPPPAKPAARAEVMAAWAVTMLLLAACMAESLYWRASIMKSWPPSQRAYALLGYRAPVNANPK